MSEPDTHAERAQPDAEPDAGPQDDEAPARRLLAHDLESQEWDHDGEDSAPPPD